MKAVQLDADRITDSKLTEITSELQAIEGMANANGGIGRSA